eukprot:TRINITY_DN2587_c0_g1_i4.p1 TRINITY_DN2587_c0_g1~~TRINITY_DN2587_c0_g1_i4.p1  ORF type:complete len:122 (+),score=31.49 TRINITY_DN2587_c0_g1_i4:129-494(+)
MHGFNTDVFFFFFFFFFLLQFPSCFNSFKKARSKLPNQLFGFRRDCRDLSVGRGLNTFHLVLQVAELDRYQDYLTLTLTRILTLTQTSTLTPTLTITVRTAMMASATTPVRNSSSNELYLL